ncbi:unnamed protein product [Peniophora sp. CBMAI 1063]|nr:unnamed protein product [Peniophora sp. CBMAI 1063]
MAHQSPMISVPRKVTDEVDWTTPIRNAIAHSYGEDPDSYAAECASLQRCRQDAVRGAGSDITARDLLYKYFGQLELLELRFPEIRVNFPWCDAFTTKKIVQTSLAYEKASIIFNIAATHSAIASSQARSDPEGIKRAFYYFRCSAGMLTYINDNFLHAPSTDLSREVIKFLVGVILAQATEVFFEKCRDEKKANVLLQRVASQTASMYTSLTEEVKEFMGKGIFDRNWVTVIQTKAKYFTSLTHYYRGLTDHTAGKYGDALVRFQLADTNAKEANRIASSFGTMFLPQMSPNLPPDAGQSLADLLKAHAALMADKRAEAQKDNDLIYNAVLPTPETLPAVEKAAVATPIPIQEVYGAPDVQRVIGPDLFSRLIPLGVHESASVYSEEKAKLLRGEIERVEIADGETRSALDALGIRAGLARFRAMVEGSVAGEDELPTDVRRWREDITLIESREPVPALLDRLNKARDSVRGALDGIGRDLEIESRDCEAARVKYDHNFTQAPSAGFTKEIRGDLKTNYDALEAANASDSQVLALWEAVKGDIQLLISGEVENVFRNSAQSGHNRRESLLDLDMEKDDGERAKIAGYVDEIEERIGRLNKIERERSETLKELKEKIVNDDVSHLLLLNRRNPNVESTIFAAELEKFKPYQQKLSSSMTSQQTAIAEVTQLWRGLRDLAGRGEGARRWEERERRKADATRRFQRARDGYMEARDGAAKGLQFYSELSALAESLRDAVKSFVAERMRERQSMIGQAEAKQRLSEPPPRPPPPPSSAASGLERSFGSMGLGNSASPPPANWGSPSTPGLPPPPPRPVQPTYSSPSQPQSSYPPPPVQGQSPYPPPPPTQAPYSPPPSQPSYGQAQAYGQTPSAPPPPPPQQRDPYAALGNMNFASPTPPPPPPSQPQRQSTFPPPPSTQGSYPPPPPGQQSYGPPQSYAPPPQQQQQQPQYGGQQSQYGAYGAPAPSRQESSPFPPPPPPVGYAQPQQQQPAYGAYGTPPPPAQQGYGQPQYTGQTQQGQYGGYNQYQR